MTIGQFESMTSRCPGAALKKQGYQTTYLSAFEITLHPVHESEDEGGSVRERGLRSH